MELVEQQHRDEESTQYEENVNAEPATMHKPAKLLFNVQVANGAQGGTPQLLVSWSRDGDPSLDLNSFGPSGRVISGRLGPVSSDFRLESAHCEQFVANPMNSRAQDLRSQEW